MTSQKVASWGVFGVVMVLAGASLLPGRPAGDFDIAGFGRLPILEGGRIKPLDSLARNSLLMIRGQQSFPAGQRVTADEWLLDVLFRPGVADRQPVFVIDDPEVLGLFGLKQTSDRYFSLQTLLPHLDDIERLARPARQLDSKQRTRFQNAVLNLYQRIGLYYRLANTVKAGVPDRGLETLSRVSTAWASQDAAAFNRAVAELARIDREAEPRAVSHAAWEALFNRAQPFYLGMILYVVAALVLFASWLWKPLPLQRASFAILAAGAVVHTAGLGARMALQGRPPVTNLYSSAIFVGWCAVVLGIVLERIYRRGFGTAVAAACGFVSLIIAHHLTGDGDTMEMMRAVLDSNIWLATHVVTITIGYSGTFLAGTLAAGYALRRQLAPRADPAITRSLVSMVYGVVCFSLFFSFVGTVLGGIWADQSWGRFWGWDPKENGALLIVLWNAIILHARWGGYVRERGLMAMAVFGNVVTSLSWFGVNMLGIGLHSYGFMEKAFWPLSIFIAAQLVLVMLCLLPPLRFHLATKLTSAQS